LRAAIFDSFRGPIEIRRVADPQPPDDGVVIRVAANGVCRSDWHGWMGHDADIRLPHVPGHELAGVIEAVGRRVCGFAIGDRVSVPFVVGCGRCAECRSGNAQVCAEQFQPGFTAWGGFAEYVAIPRADLNLVALPEAMDFVDAAALGCRFATAWRAVVEQGRVRPGEWVAVHGCGGVGLSAVMIAAAAGALPIAVDISVEALSLARDVGAVAALNGREVDDIPAAIAELSGGGAQLSLDALGSPPTARNSLLGLRPRGRHVQVGLLLADAAETPLPMDRVVGAELEIRGSHGMAAQRYPQLLDAVAAGRLAPQRLVRRRISLSAGAGLLARMDEFPGSGIAVITDFSA